jgi:hypothetical protein
MRRHDKLPPQHRLRRAYDIEDPLGFIRIGVGLVVDGDNPPTSLFEFLLDLPQVTRVLASNG